MTSTIAEHVALGLVKVVEGREEDMNIWYGTKGRFLKNVDCENT